MSYWNQFIIGITIMFKLFIYEWCTFLKAPSKLYRGRVNAAGQYRRAGEVQIEWGTFRQQGMEFINLGIDLGLHFWPWMFQWKGLLYCF